MTKGERNITKQKKGEAKGGKLPNFSMPNPFQHGPKGMCTGYSNVVEKLWKWNF
jgi:hypothetical protein